MFARLCVCVCFVCVCVRLQISILHMKTGKVVWRREIAYEHIHNRVQQQWKLIQQQHYQLLLNTLHRNRNCCVTYIHEYVYIIWNEYKVVKFKLVLKKHHIEKDYQRVHKVSFFLTFFPNWQHLVKKTEHNSFIVSIFK